MSERFPDAPIALNRPTVGMVLCMTGLLAFTAHDVVMKLLSDRYSVWELAFVRSLVVLAVIAGVVAIISGPRALRTRRLGLHTLRGVLALSSYTCYYLGIAAMPIVEAAAMFAVGPVLVTALSVPLLGEKVGARRWCAITVAFVGVVVMLRPGTELFRAASLFPMAAATIYAFAVVVTRQLGTTETGSRMAFYTGFVYLAGSVLAGAIIGVWQPSFSSDPSVAFLLRPWQWPQWRDLGLMCLGGVFAAVGFVALSGAYRMAPVAVVAPFEYSQLLWAFGLGYVFFGDLPGATTVAGVAVVISAGVYIYRREAAGSARAGDSSDSVRAGELAGSANRELRAHPGTGVMAIAPGAMIALGLALLLVAIFLQVVSP